MDDEATGIEGEPSPQMQRSTSASGQAPDPCLPADAYLLFIWAQIMNEPVDSAYSYTAKQIDGRMLIECKCSVCGAAKIVSRADGSLDQWKKDHASEHEQRGSSQQSRDGSPRK